MLTRSDRKVAANHPNFGEGEGCVYWITGLSGSGKTTIARLVVEKFGERRPVLLDGDELRDVFGGGFGYSREDRLRLAMVYSRLCRALAAQGFDVVIATIAMYSDIRGWNRSNIRNYFEIYLRVPVEVLASRDPKGLYARARRGEVRDVMGIDLTFDEPEHPHLVIDNFGACTPQQAADAVFSAIGAA